MKIAFLKGTGIIDKMIKLWTWSKYSHCEMIFSDDTTIGTSLAFPFTVSISTKVYDPKFWDIVEVNVTYEEELIMKQFALEQIGKKYDWCGIFFSIVFPFKRDTSNRWFCSELCTAIFQKIHRLSMIFNKKACTVSPGKFSKLIATIKK